MRKGGKYGTDLALQTIHDSIPDVAFAIRRATENGKTGISYLYESEIAQYPYARIKATIKKGTPEIILSFKRFRKGDWELERLPKQFIRFQG